PAGSSAALSAACRGARVLMAERKAVVGKPIRCAEYIPAPLLGEVGPGRDFVVQGVRGMRTILPDGEEKTIRTPGFMIARDLFDQALCRAARDAGAGLLLDTRVISWKDGRVLVRQRGGDPGEIRARVVIGADGPHTTVGRWIDSVNRSLIPAVQVRVPLVNSMDFTEVHFQRSFYGGYGWLFPRGREANVGLGIKRVSGGEVRLCEALDRFVVQLEEKGRVRNQVLCRAAGWIPAEALRRVVKGPFMLVGDAAGHTHPVTGAGVFQAVTGGAMAGRWAVRSLQEQDPDLLTGYEEEWRDLFAESHERGFRRRQLLEKEWGRLSEVVKRCWVAFREYYGNDG
ncbi:MAG: NAD(P)/FAD-dependent oxidoreductase, partial [Deltaproteobacteria bacterium]|nr:NAD(P)/FAD-dependent oxidoreductase [Deltaproteobacteria bacterium]